MIKIKRGMSVYDVVRCALIVLASNLPISDLTDDEIDSRLISYTHDDGTVEYNISTLKGVPLGLNFKKHPDGSMYSSITLEGYWHNHTAVQAMNLSYLVKEPE